MRMPATCSTAALAAWLALATPVVCAAADISGKYSMKGKSDLATAAGYQGTCELRQQVAIYDATCVSGNDNYRGKGILHGQGFSLYLGQFLVVYEIGGDGVMTGRWVNGVNGETGKETLTPIK